MADKQFFFTQRAWGQSHPEGTGLGEKWSVANDEGEIRFAQGVRIGDVVYVAGQVAWDKNGNIVGSDLLTQSRQIFRNIAEILDLAGASLTDVVRLTQYFVDMRDIRAYRQARREAMPGVTCITTGIQVARMTHPDLLLEIEAMAVV